MRGDGCECYARSEGECCCDVDWTDPEVYELQGRVEELKGVIRNMHQHVVDNGIDAHYYHEMMLKGLEEKT